MKSKKYMYKDIKKVLIKCVSIKTYALYFNF